MYKHDNSHCGDFHYFMYRETYPDSKFHGANMGPIWGRQDPDGPHASPMNLAIWDISSFEHKSIV